MRVLLVSSFLVAIAACNTPSQGVEGNVLFTPDHCGNALLGCDFADPIATGGLVDVQISGIDGFSTAGLDLAARSPAVLSVTKVANQGGRPTWQLTGVGDGTSDLAAIDGSGREVDSIAITVRTPDHLGLMNLVGDAVGPAPEVGADEGWTVNADQLVSFQAIPRVGALDLMGRLAYDVVVPSGSTLLDSEQSSSDRPTGYLYIQPPAGTYPFTFELTAATTVFVDVVLHAQ